MPLVRFSSIGAQLSAAVHLLLETLLLCILKLYNAIETRIVLLLKLTAPANTDTAVTAKPVSDVPIVQLITPQTPKTDQKLTQLAYSKKTTNGKLKKLTKSSLTTEEKLKELTNSTPTTDGKLTQLTKSTPSATDEKLTILHPYSTMTSTTTTKIDACKRQSMTNVKNGSATNVKNVSATNVKNGSATNVKNVSATNVKNGSATNVKNGSATNVKNGSATNVKNGSATNVNNGSVTKVINGLATNVKNGSATNVKNGSATNVKNGSADGCKPSQQRKRASPARANPVSTQYVRNGGISMSHRFNGPSSVIERIEEEDVEEEKGEHRASSSVSSVMLKGNVLKLSSMSTSNQNNGVSDDVQSCMTPVTTPQPCPETGPSTINGVPVTRYHLCCNGPTISTAESSEVSPEVGDTAHKWSGSKTLPSPVPILVPKITVEPPFDPHPEPLPDPGPGRRRQTVTFRPAVVTIVPVKRKPTRPRSALSKAPEATVVALPKQTRFVTTTFEVSGGEGLTECFDEVEAELRHWVSSEPVIFCEVLWSSPCSSSGFGSESNSETGSNLGSEESLERELKNLIRSCVDRPMRYVCKQLRMKNNTVSSPGLELEDTEQLTWVGFANKFAHEYLENVRIGCYTQCTTALLELAHEETGDAHSKLWDPEDRSRLSPLDKLLKLYPTEELKEKAVLAVNFICLEL